MGLIGITRFGHDLRRFQNLRETKRIGPLYDEVVRLL